MAVVSAPGAAGGLWTHTPVDWRGNEFTPPIQQAPAAWPSDAVNGAPGSGTRPGINPPGQGVISATPTPGSGSVTITWTTTIPMDSNVDLGVTGALGQHYNDPTMVTSHSVVITGLIHSQLYNYRVSSNASGYSALGNPSTFTTLA